jgi:hypothetical protein
MEIMRRNSFTPSSTARLGKVSQNQWSLDDFCVEPLHLTSSLVTDMKSQAGRQAAVVSIYGILGYCTQKV